ncbi:hypothetical protein [Pedobacter frigiditerrae]|uniref:hypothetical protein n=1 Tax=Pedobacter frigiditerrae TaxID=2530452 RepID=UPI00292E8F96|nr:hypothetical protein [Pedobacter frigiditerrae]
MYIGIYKQQNRIVSFEAFCLLTGISHVSVKQSYHRILNGHMKLFIEAITLHSYNLDKTVKQNYIYQCTQCLEEQLYKLLQSLSTVGDPSKSYSIEINTAHYIPRLDYYVIEDFKKLFYPSNLQIIQALQEINGDKHVVMFFDEDLNENPNEIKFRVIGESLEQYVEDYLNYDLCAEENDIEEFNFDVSTDMRIQDNDNSEWKRNYFDAITDGQLGDYDDFQGDVNNLDSWSGR